MPTKQSQYRINELTFAQITILHRLLKGTNATDIKLQVTVCRAVQDATDAFDETFRL